MRILHLTGEFPPLVLGGLGTYVAAVAQQQIVQGDTVLVGVLRGEAKKYNTVAKPARDGRLTVAWRQFQPEKFAIDQFKIQAATEIIKQFKLQQFIAFKPDVIHVHDWYGALWGAALQQVLGVPLVFTSHLPTRAGFVYSGHSLALKHKTQFEALGLRVADRVTVPSQFLADVLTAEYNVPATNITVIPNGIDEQFFAPLNSITETKTQPIRLLTVARLTEQKGLAYLIQAVAHLKAKGISIHCTVVGEGPLKQSLKTEIKNSGLQKTISLIGFRDHLALQKLYRQSDIFVSTSIYEPFGLVVLEAMAAGIPVVAFQTGGIPEILANGKFGVLVPPCDAVALSKAIGTLVTSPSQMKKVGQTGQHRAHEFAWKNIVLQLQQVYQQLAV